MANRTNTQKPDTHLLHYLKKRDAMVARAVSNRIKQRFLLVEKSRDRKFYSISTLSRISHPPITTSITPTKTSATALVSSFVSLSTLVREPLPSLVKKLKPIRQVKAKRLFKEKMASPPASRTRSKTQAKSVTLEPTNPQIPSIDQKDKKPKASFESDLLQNITQCKFHTCNKKHKCPKAPPWPALCASSSCDKVCTLRAQVCDGCGTVLCFDHTYVGVCPYPF